MTLSAVSLGRGPSDRSRADLCELDPTRWGWGRPGVRRVGTAGSWLPCALPSVAPAFPGSTVSVVLLLRGPCQLLLVLALAATTVDVDMSRGDSFPPRDGVQRTHVCAKRGGGKSGGGRRGGTSRPSRPWVGAARGTERCRRDKEKRIGSATAAMSVMATAMGYGFGDCDGYWIWSCRWCETVLPGRPPGPCCRVVLQEK